MNNFLPSATVAVSFFFFSFYSFYFLTSISPSIISYSGRISICLSSCVCSHCYSHLLIKRLIHDWQCNLFFLTFDRLCFVSVDLRSLISISLWKVQRSSKVDFCVQKCSFSLCFCFYNPYFLLGCFVAWYHLSSKHIYIS
jgi:hypothetical protein